MNPIPSTLLTDQLVQLGCLTLPMHVRLLDNQIMTYDYQHPFLRVERRFPPLRSIRLNLMSAMAVGNGASGRSTA